MNKALLKCSNKAYKLYKRQIGSDKISLERKKYVTYRNTLNRIKLHEKKAYYNQLVETHKNDSKKLWGIINQLTGEK